MRMRAVVMRREVNPAAAARDTARGDSPLAGLAQTWIPLWTPASLVPLFRLQRRPPQYTGLERVRGRAAAHMPACVDSLNYTFPCPANYTGACPANGLWTCADWQAKGIYTCEGPAAAAFGVDEAASIALLRECQSACPSTCTSPSRCTDGDACRNAKYELVQENAECGASTPS